MLKKIALLGPESTGKSSLAKELAKHYKTDYVPEFARAYLSKLERKYNQEDLLEIAKGQLKSIQSSEKRNNGYLFIDTELIVIKIWSEFKYKNVHPWILNELSKQDIDLYLLTDIDLDWEPDPLRENPQEREHLLNLYEKELKTRKLPYFKVSGQGNQRVLNAINSIDNFCL